MEPPRGAGHTGRRQVFNIINTVYPGYLMELIGHAQRQRVSVVASEMATNTILVTEDWINDLNAVPFHSKVSQFVQLLTSL